MKWFALGGGASAVIAAGVALTAWLGGALQTTSDSATTIYRGNLQRTGLYHATGVREFHELAWTFKQSARGICYPPSVSQGNVYIGCSGPLRVLDMHTGEEKWRLGGVDIGVHTPPTLADGLLYFGSNFLMHHDRLVRDVEWRIRLAVVDPASQALVGEFTPAQSKIDSSPVVVDGTVYFTTGSGSLYAWDLATGGEKWEFQTGGASLPLTAAPAVANGIIYFTNANSVPAEVNPGGAIGHLYAVDMETAQEVWRFPTSVSTSPVVADGLVFALADADSLVALDANTGAERWRVGGALSQPAVADGVVYVGSKLEKLALAEGGSTFASLSVNSAKGGRAGARAARSQLQALDAQTGQERWKITVQGELSVPLSIANGAIYFWTKTDTVGRMYAVDLTTREPLWTYVPTDMEPVGGIEFAPVIGDGMVFFTGAFKVYAIR